MKNLTIICLIASCLFAYQNTGYTAQKATYVPGELLVKYKPSVQVAASAYYRSMMGISNIRKFKKIGVQHVKLPKNMTVAEALGIYRNDPDVEYAEPNYYRYATATPNDTSFDQLWGLHNTGQDVGQGDQVKSGTDDADIDAPEAWDITTGSSDVVVAVIDSGVDYNHPDLAANIWTNTGEIAGNGIDDDGNGYVDDVSGWDFFNDDNDPVDSNEHGTHVAGIIAAVGNNSTGVAGVSWTAKIMPLRVIGALGYVSDIISAIQYATEKGAHVINLSLGGPNSSIAEKAAIDASSAVVVCAAGNDGTDNDTSPFYPASYDSPNIIAVAATDQDDALASFSNFGVTSVDVAAPGKNIYSTIPARQTVENWGDDFDDGDISDWTTGGTNNTWGITRDLSYSSPYSLTDSPGDDYINDTDSWAIAPVLNLSTYSGTKLEFQLNGVSETDTDFLYIEVSTDLTSWTKQLSSVVDDYDISGSTSDEWF
ncbi:S8 family peptidase, partial [Thermodesulfobacteriota bacterium]